MFELKQKEKIKVSIYGKEYGLRRPTVKDADLLANLSDGKSDKEKLDLTISLLDNLGLPKAVCETVEIDSFKDLVEYIFGSVKKN